MLDDRIMAIYPRSRQWRLDLAGAILCLALTAAPLMYGQETARAPASGPQVWCGVHVMAWGLADGDQGLAPLKEAVVKVLARRE